MDPARGAGVCLGGISVLWELTHAELMPETKKVWPGTSRDVLMDLMSFAYEGGCHARQDHFQRSDTLQIRKAQ
jgi:hypothetical protein